MSRVVICASVLALFSGLAVLASPGTGSIQGTVVDRHGKPVRDARVIASLLGAPEPDEKSARTDANGRFVVPDLPWGKYRVGAEKPEEGYPNMSLTFYSNGPEPAPVSLNPAKPQANLHLTIKSKAGVLSGTVSDAVSNDPVRATFLLRRADQPLSLIHI